MASVRKGQLAKAPSGVSWHRHIGGWWKRQLWKKERKAGKKEAKQQLKD